MINRFGMLCLAVAWSVVFARPTLADVYVDYTWAGTAAAGGNFTATLEYDLNLGFNPGTAPGAFLTGGSVWANSEYPLPAPPSPFVGGSITLNGVTSTLFGDQLGSIDLEADNGFYTQAVGTAPNGSTTSIYFGAEPPSGAGSLIPFSSFNQAGVYLNSAIYGYNTQNQCCAMKGDPSNFNGASLTWDSLTISPGVAPVPLPSSLWLMLSGLGGIAALSKRKRVA